MPRFYTSMLGNSINAYPLLTLLCLCRIKRTSETGANWRNAAHNCQSNTKNSEKEQRKSKERAKKEGGKSRNCNFGEWRWIRFSLEKISLTWSSAVSKLSPRTMSTCVGCSDVLTLISPSWDSAFKYWTLGPLATKQR